MRRGGRKRNYATSPVAERTQEPGVTSGQRRGQGVGGPRPGQGTPLPTARRTTLSAAPATSPAPASGVSITPRDHPREILEECVLYKSTCASFSSGVSLTWEERSGKGMEAARVPPRGVYCIFSKSWGVFAFCFDASLNELGPTCYREKINSSLEAEG